MIFLNFRPNDRKYYKIIRDYPSEQNRKRGILFILENPENKITFSHFLPQESLNNTYIWNKVKDDEYHYISRGVEGGKESELIIETGFIKMKKRNFLFKEGEVTATAKKYKFILKDN